MTIGEILKYNDINTYKKFMQLSKKTDKPKKNIVLGDSIENLMGHRSYKKVKGRIVQLK